MKLKYEIGVHRNIFESNFISNLNQVISDDKTWDMVVSVGHVKVVLGYLFSTDFPNIARYSVLPELDRCLKLDMDISFDFQMVWSHQNIPVSMRSVKSAKRSEPIQTQNEWVNSSHWIVSYQIS